MALIQIIVNSLIIGSLYALVACGFSLIYSTNKFMHFAHGISVVIASYLFYLSLNTLKINFIISILLVLILTGLFGIFMYKVFYGPLQKRKSSNIVLLIASVGILILFENMIMLVFGTTVKTINSDLTKSIEFSSFIITPLQIIIIVTSLILLLLLYLLMKKTKIGRNMRAVSDNKELASIIGIDYKKVSYYSFFIGSLLAGIAGIFIALEQTLEPTIGTNLIVKGFTGSIIGGITSVPGSILGSYILGIAENFGIWYLSSGYKDAIAFTLLFLFLLFKPHGILGINKGIKK
ncbi:branched-chain amino acid ABC transporter permease [Candidatus Woesearchaeota archaeon]|nr:branched-chain amino acid ABC transporter permease [Candidatus Woesearchaeota archaeon]